MESLRTLVVRDDKTLTDETSQDATLSPTMVQLLIALFCLVMVGLLSVIALYFLRSMRRKRVQKEVLPTYNQARKNGHRRTLTITAAPFVNRPISNSYSEKKHFLDDDNSSTAPSSPVPQIHITFPEEEDKSGRRQSARVVVVQINDNGGVGLAPYEEQPLPPYQPREGENWKSLDLERMGGLKEKESGKHWS